MSIKTVIRMKNDGVMVFDAGGEQVPEYQGQYQEVREDILKHAPFDAVFAHWLNETYRPKIVTRENW